MDNFVLIITAIIAGLVSIITTVLVARYRRKDAPPTEDTWRGLSAFWEDAYYTLRSAIRRFLASRHPEDSLPRELREAMSVHRKGGDDDARPSE